LSSRVELFGLIGSWIKEWQPSAPITEMWIELPVLEGAGRRQLRLWAGGDGNSEEVIAALERLQERHGQEVVRQPRPAVLSSPLPAQRFAWSSPLPEGERSVSPSYSRSARRARERG
jgi:hypothetical protein